MKGGEKKVFQQLSDSTVVKGRRDRHQGVGADVSNEEEGKYNSVAPASFAPLRLQYEIKDIRPRKKGMSQSGKAPQYGVIT